MKHTMEGLDRGTNMYVVLCDLSKAFACYNLDILLTMMEYYGIRSNALKLFQSLYNRQQYGYVDIANLTCYHRG